MNKISMIDKLTLYQNKTEYKVEIDEKFSSIASLDELDDLENSSSVFFDVLSIGKQGNKIFIVYDVPKEYESFNQAKRFEKLLRLQLVQKLLEINPLFECENKTYLDLNNIFFKDFKTIKLLYRSNGKIPYHSDVDALEQYKLFVLGFMSEKYPYKKFVVNKDSALKKENNSFLFAVNAAQSYIDLKDVVEKELNKTQNEYYKKIQFNVDSKKKGRKRKIILSLFFIFIVSLLFVGGMKQNELAVAKSYESQIDAMKLDQEIYQATSEHNIEKAIKLMKKRGDNKSKIAKMLVDVGQYDEAIKMDKDVEESVISKLYALGEKDKILSLKSNSNFIETEKDIVRYNIDSLDSSITLITNKNTLKRLGLAYIEHNNIDMAKEVENRLKDKELGNYIKKAELEEKLEKYNSELYTLKESKKGNNSDKIKSINDDIISLQKELIQLEEQMGIDK